MERENLSKLQDVVYDYINIVEYSRNYITEACKICEAKDLRDVNDIAIYCLKSKIKLNTNKFDKYGKEELIPAINYSAFREFSKEYSGIAESAGIVEELIPEEEYNRLIKNKKPDPAKFVECVEYLAPCLDFTHVTENLDNFTKAFQALWDRIKNKRNARQSLLYMYSTIGGTGKTTLCNFILEWARRKNIKATTTDIPTNQFIGPEFSKNLICVIPEVSKSMIENWHRINNVVDGGSYIVELKGLTKYQAKSRALVICCSNFLPKEDNPRRLKDSYVYFGSTPLNLRKKEHHALSRMTKDGEFDYDFYVNLVEQALLSVPDDPDFFSKYSYLVPFRTTDYSVALDSDFQRDLLFKIAKYYDQNPGDDHKSVSALTLSNRINRWLKNTYTQGLDDISLNEVSPRSICGIFKSLQLAGLIRLTKLSDSLQGRKYDLSNIIKDKELILNPPDREVDESSLDEVMIEKKIMDSIIAAIRSENPTTPDDDNDKTDHFDFTITEDSEVKADFNRITYQDKFSTTPHMNEEKDPYMLNGTFKEEYIKKCVENKETISRKAENIIPQYFVFECDTKSLEEQVDFINSWNESLKKEVKTITFSGNKSYHVLFPIKVSEDITASEYKTLWTQFMKRNSLIEYADTQCGSLSRLTRNPGGIREDGTVQKCLYFNKDCEVIDLDLDLITLRQTQKEIEEFNKKNRQSSLCFSSTDKTPEEILSSIKKDCDAKRGWEMIESCNYPSGTDFLSPASGMYSVLTGSGVEENEAINWIRSNYLERVAEIHPSNISMNKAKNWMPRR